AIDPDGDTLTYLLTTEPAGMTVDSQSGLVRWTPPIAGKSLQFAGGNLFVTPNLASSFPAGRVTPGLLVNANGPGVLVKELDTTPPGSPSTHDSQIEVVDHQVLIKVQGVSAITLGTITFGTWHHVALRYSEASHSLDGFLDGVKSVSATGIRSR